MMSPQSNGDRRVVSASAFCHLRWQTARRWTGRQDPKRARKTSVTSSVRHPVTKLREAIRTNPATYPGFISQTTYPEPGVLRQYVSSPSVMAWCDDAHSAADFRPAAHG
jgi:hypothetical protein